MPKNINDVMREMSPASQDRIKARAAQLIAEEMTLREMRKVLQLTQEDVARKMGVKQDKISRLEKRKDVLVSTLQSAVRAMGGELVVSARFPKQRTIVLSGLGAREGGKATTSKKIRKTG